jgi:hypothetical protein
MNNLLLSDYCVVEVSEAEGQELSGGWLKEIVAGLLISAADNWQDIREGWSDGVNGKKPRH